MAAAAASFTILTIIINSQLHMLIYYPYSTTINAIITMFKVANSMGTTLMIITITTITAIVIAAAVIVVITIN